MRTAAAELPLCCLPPPPAAGCGGFDQDEEELILTFAFIFSPPRKGQVPEPPARARGHDGRGELQPERGYAAGEAGVEDGGGVGVFVFVGVVVVKVGMRRRKQIAAAVVALSARSRGFPGLALLHEVEEDPEGPLRELSFAEHELEELESELLGEAAERGERVDARGGLVEGELCERRRRWHARKSALGRASVEGLCR